MTVSGSSVDAHEHRELGPHLCQHGRGSRGAGRADRPRQRSSCRGTGVQGVLFAFRPCRLLLAPKERPSRVFMQLFDLAVSPWPSAETGLRFGLGPTFVFPTATSKFAGQGAWQAGPACAAVYTRVPRLLIGFLLQNPISFAYTSPDRPSQNTLAFQPVALFFSLRWVVLAILSRVFQRRGYYCKRVGLPHC